MGWMIFVEVLVFFFCEFLFGFLFGYVFLFLFFVDVVLLCVVGISLNKNECKK